MIEDASTMDRPLDTRRARRMKRIRLALLILVPITLAALFFPTISSWFRSEHTVALSRVRIGEAHPCPTRQTSTAPLLTTSRCFPSGDHAMGDGPGKGSTGVSLTPSL